MTGPTSDDGTDVALSWSRIARHFGESFAAEDAPPLGVAVSGGGDSTALLHLLNDWRLAGGPDLVAVTVDHGLRPEAADEARRVGTICAALNIPHDTLHWRDWNGCGNLQDAARRARYELIAGWARDRGLAHVALGHTADDVAETFLMRLSRRAGLDGLSMMAPQFSHDAVTFHRPMLYLGRDELRRFLTARGLSWSDDPSNENPAFARVRARQALSALGTLGVGTDELAAVARNLAHDRATLGHYVARAGHELTTVQAGDLLIARDPFQELPEGVARRLLAAGLVWVSGARYPPRAAPLDAMMQAVRAGQGGTLHGCLLRVGRNSLRLSREWQAVANLVAPPGQIWDGRWIVTPPADVQGDAVKVSALGEEGMLQLCQAWRETGLPRSSALATPAVWRAGQLLAAPLLGRANGWQARLVRDHAALLRVLGAKMHD